MNDIVFVFLFLIVGLVAGTGAGLLGIGGGIIYIPSLLFLLPLIGIPKEQVVLTAITTSLFTAIFSSGTALYNHFKLNDVVVKKAILFVIGSIITSTIVPGFVVKMNPIVPQIVLLSILIAALVKIYFFKNENIISKYLLNDYYIILFGLLVGAISAMSGVGGGIIVVPVLTIFFGLDFKHAIGTSTMVAFITLSSSSFSYWLASGSTEGVLGFINLFAVLPMIVGAVIGSIYGVKMGHKFSVSTIKGIFSLLLLFAILKIVISL